jgi:NAD(P)-dependent dehydrogenase (short-subunit alcohol dehydrogenase family)
MIAQITRDKENPLAVGVTQAITAIHPWETLGRAEDIARAAVFLVSEDAQWVTGHQLVVDGGYIAR